MDKTTEPLLKNPKYRTFVRDVRGFSKTFKVWMKRVERCHQHNKWLQLVAVCRSKEEAEMVSLFAVMHGVTEAKLVMAEDYKLSRVLSAFRKGMSREEAWAWAEKPHELQREDLCKMCCVVMRIEKSDLPEVWVNVKPKPAPGDVVIKAKAQLRIPRLASPGVLRKESEGAAE